MVISILNNTEEDFHFWLNMTTTKKAGPMTRKLLPGSNQRKGVKPQQQQLVTLQEIYNKRKGELKIGPKKIE